MVPLHIAKALPSGAQAEDAAVAQRVATALFLVGALAGFGHAFLSQGPSGRPTYLACSAGLGLLGALSFAGGERPALLTLSAQFAIVLIAALLSVPDPSAAVPLFLLWPLIFLAYFRSPAVLVGGFVLSALAFAVVLVVGASTESRIVYMSALSTAFLASGLVAVMRAAQLRLQAQLEEASHADPLTGLLNRRAFNPAFAALLARPGRSPDVPDQDLSLVLLDLDHFKRYNDTHGHPGGDDALRRLSRILTRAAGSAGLVGRYGGEEFVVALDRLAGAPSAAEFTSAVARELAWEAVDEADRLTVSCGVASLSGGLLFQRARALDAGSDVPRACSLETLITMADDALYAAKHAGRARTAIWAAGTLTIGKPHVEAASAGSLDVATPPGQASSRSIRTGRRQDHAAPSTTRPRRPRDPRAVLIKRVVVTMFATGALNFVVALLAVDYTPFTLRWQLIITSVTVVGVVVAAASPGGVRMAQVAGLWSALIVAATTATIAPMISAPLFGVWSVIFVAYFCSRRFIAFSLVWCGVWFAAALVALPADGPKAVTWAGMIVNASLAAAVIGILRSREERLRRRLELAAGMDPLTGLLNRRAFGVELESALSLGQPLCVVMLDADHFKRFNDTHGHLAGDRALQAVSAELRDTARGLGFACRFGGEEFAVALPGSTIDGARAYTERLARGLLKRFPEPETRVTVSAGIALAASPGVRDVDESEAVLARADATLYLAKAAGRARAAWPSQDGASIVMGTPVAESRPWLVDEPAAALLDRAA